jgi:xeroderma pigmentosum group C-complementing protein
MGGGFLPEGHEEEEEERTANLTSGFFPVVDEEDGEHDIGLLEVDHGEVAHKPPTAPAKPVPRTKPKSKTAIKTKAPTTRRSGRLNVTRSEEVEEGEDSDDGADSGL